MENVTLDNYQFYVDFGELISKVSGFILIFTNAQTNVAIKSFLITKADLQLILQKPSQLCGNQCTNFFSQMQL